MDSTYLPSDRRRFLGLTANILTAILATGCGEDGTNGSPLLVSAPGAAAAATVGDPLNLPLNLAYVGAQFYGYAARGYGLPPGLTTGVGETGSVIGARQATFGDEGIAAYAAEIADDKQRHVTALRDRIGATAAAQPVLDLSVDPTSAFSIAAQAAGVVAPGGSFDPYAGDEQFLLAAFFIENAVAATYRTLLAASVDPAVADILSANLADSIYHDGLIRTLLDERAIANPGIATAVRNAGVLLGRLDGSNVGDQTLAGSTGDSSNILDAAGRPIPFTRAPIQVLRALYLSGTPSRGFIPAGVNGVAA